MTNAHKIFSFYWRHLRHHPRTVSGLLLAIPLTTLVSNYLPPLILAVVLSRLSHHDFQPHHVWASFGSSLVAYAALSLLGGVVTWRIVDILTWSLEGKIEQAIAQQVFGHLLRQSADFHANQFSGSLVSQTNKLMGAYIRIADTSIFQVLPLLSGLIFVSIIMAHRSPLYTGALIIFAIFYMISAFFVTRRVRRLGAEQAAAESQQTGVLADALTNVMAIKSFARESYENRMFEEATTKTRRKLHQLMLASQRQQSFFSVVTSLMSALALSVAVIGVVTFGANIATVFLIFSYTASIVNQLFTFSNNSLRNYNRAFGDATDMINILALEPEIKDPIKPESNRMHHGNISFREVSFTHQDAEDAIFQSLNLQISDGEKIGLVGHSGSGKTTFTRLLLRFSDLDSGTITIDGQNIAAVTQTDLHQSIAYVPQEPLLFHRTIRDNIGYGKASASQAEIIQAAERAHATEFIDQLPKGYATVVGERGVKLSGGQRQRIAIARAMLKNAPILLLDEATSALDSESEVLIQDALWKLMEGRTAIVIAHRLSTIQKMDRIIVLDNGEIVEQGTHQQLLKLKNTYAKLWAHQSGGFMDD